MPENQRERGETCRSVIARVCPNEDITSAVKTICASAGIRTAAIRGGIGSLIGATLTGPAERGPVRVEGPGTEVATLVGLLTTNTAGEPEVTINCTLVDKYGQVHAGTLVPGENPVAVTFELLIQELNPIPGGTDLPEHQKEALA
nr:PPC domain-containing DNA-binding protein [Arthrobacter sp. zg-Y769]